MISTRVTEGSLLVGEHDELVELANMIEILEGAYKELPLVIFLLKIGLHQARARLRTGEAEDG